MHFHCLCVVNQEFLFQVSKTPNKYAQLDRNEEGTYDVSVGEITLEEFILLRFTKDPALIFLNFVSSLEDILVPPLPRCLSKSRNPCHASIQYRRVGAMMRCKMMSRSCQILLLVYS